MLLSSSLSGLMARRAFLLGIAAWQAQSGTVPASAAQRGAEDAYAPQRFDDTFVCVKRTPLGACAEQGKSKALAPPAPVVLSPSTVPGATTLDLKTPEENDLIRGLLARSAENADANAREVREKSFKNSLGGQFGPFSKDAPVMKPDGSFEVITISALERYKDKKWVVKGENGLNKWVEGYDKEKALAAEKKQKSKFLGLF